MKIGINKDINTDNQLLTSHQVGALLQMNPSSINKWVKEGKIEAFRTPGGHRRIRVRDLVTFLEVHKMPIPNVLVKTDKPKSAKPKPKSKKR